MWRDRRISSGHHDEIERQLEDHRGAQGADDGTGQGRPLTQWLAHLVDDGERRHDSSQGHEGDGVRGRGPDQVLLPYLPDVDDGADRERGDRQDARHQHEGGGCLAGPACSNGKAESSPAVKQANPNGQ